MRLALRLAAAALLASGAASGALPPHYQRLAELRAVLNHAEVASGLGRPIDRIEWLGPDLYRVSAGRCHIDVRIVTLPTPHGLVGARRFEARPGRPVCGPGGRR